MLLVLCGLGKSRLREHFYLEQFELEMSLFHKMKTRQTPESTKNQAVYIKEGLQPDEDLFA